jgi:hypothetical protein
MKVSNKVVGPSLALFAVAAGAAVFAAGNARGAPSLGQILKFDQQPLNNVNINGAVYNGHDEASWASINTASGGYSGPGVADDFADLYNTPVVRISWWGSYSAPSGTVITPVPNFLISFEADVPVSPNNPFSHPGSPLLVQTLTRDTSGGLPPADQFTEQSVSGASNLYFYNGELSIPFPEQANTVYWLKIAALLPSPSPSVTWGWHNRDYTTQDTLASTPPAVTPGEHNANTAAFPVWSFQDDAVTSALNYFPANGVVDETNFKPLFYQDTVDGPTGISSFSEDMAYQLYTTPEPATLGLVVVGGLGLLLKRKQTRSA